MVLWQWLRWVIVEWLVIVVCFWLLSRTSFSWLTLLFYWLPIVIVIGSRQHALAILGHDGAHGLACHPVWLNDVLTNLLCLCPLLTPMGGYRHFHFKHHLNVGTGDDPEIWHKSKIKQWETPFSWLRLLGQIVCDFFGGGIPHILMLTWLTRPVSVIDAIPVVLFWANLSIILWFTGYLWILAFWMISILTSFWAIFRLRIWTEHVRTNYVTKLGKPPLLARLLFLPHNTWCHYEHHKNQTIPFWKLGQDGKSLRSHLEFLVQPKT